MDTLDKENDTRYYGDSLGPLRPSMQISRHSMGGSGAANVAGPRTSLERTRADMLAANQLDNRYSVERARVSLDLPGVTHAAALMKQRSRQD